MTDQTHPGVRDEASPDNAVIPDTRSPSDLIPLQEAPAVEPGRAPSRRWIAIAVLGGCALLAGIAVGPSAMRIMSQKDAVLTTPATIGTLTRDDSPQAREAVTDFVAALRAMIDLDSSLGAIYLDAAGPDRSVMLFGGTALLFDPEAELDTVLSLMEEHNGGFSKFTTVDPGSLGGAMKCAGNDDDGMVLSMCGWADHGTIALALFPGRTPNDAAQLMSTVRAACLSRG